MDYMSLVDNIKSHADKHPTDISVHEDWFNACRAMISDNQQAGHRFNGELRRRTTQIIVNGKTDVSTTGKFYDLHKRSLLLDAPVDFDAYCQYLEWNRDPEKRFYQPRRNALRGIAQSLQELADNKLDLLAISLPPGCGKTTLAIFYLTWLAGRVPDKPILTGSHSNSFVRGVYDECLRILDPQGEYLWHDVFQGTQVVNTNAKDCRIDLGQSKRFETLEFTSIGTGNAGLYRAATLLYCDDLVSGIEVALSKERLDKLWEVYTTDLRQRKIGNVCKELHIATRWSVHDVIGRLEREYGSSDKARFITIPALNQEDKSNFDYPHGVGFSTQFYHEQRDIMDDASWRALYMNEPIEREGLLYDMDGLHTYLSGLPSIEPDGIVGICDTAEGGGDDTVLLVGYLYGSDCYIDDCVCSNALPEVTDALCAEILVRHKVQMCRFESNSAGGRTADKVDELVKAQGGITHITKKRTTANKETKIIVNSSYVKEHFWFKDKSRYDRNSTYGRMINKLCSYTVAGKNKHDDVPDAMAQLALFIQSLSAAKVTVFQRPF